MDSLLIGHRVTTYGPGVKRGKVTGSLPTATHPAQDGQPFERCRHSHAVHQFDTGSNNNPEKPRQSQKDTA
jgi:hypothetical protein